MKPRIFKTLRRGLLGDRPMGTDYMQEVNERTKKMKAALRDPEQPTDKRQSRLPGF